MKKLKIFTLVIFVLCLAGCGKNYDVVCTQTFDEKSGDSTIKHEARVEFNEKNGKITDSHFVMKFDTQEDAKEWCSMLQSVHGEKIVCNGKEITSNNYFELEKNLGNDVTTKEEGIKSLESQGFTCK